MKESYNEMLHPQKRRLMKDVLVAVMGRILEIKHVDIILNLDSSRTKVF